MAPSTKRNGTERALTAISWLAVGVLAVVTVFHLAQREPLNIILGLIAVTPWVYTVAWATTAVGVWSKRRWLACVSIVLVGFQLWWTVPDFDPISHISARTPGAAHLLVFDLNVSQNNDNLIPVAKAVERYHPEVVALEELNPLALKSLLATEAMKRYRYRIVDAEWGSYGMALWSRDRLSDLSEWYAAGHPELKGWIWLAPGERARLDIVHPEAPYGSGEPQGWVAQFGAIAAELRHEPKPMIVVGDFNATWYDWHFQSVLKLGLRDAAVIAGQGWRMTFPRNRSLVPPYIRIDHVLVPAGWGVTSYRVLSLPGPAHDALLVGLQSAAHQRRTEGT